MADLNHYLMTQIALNAGFESYHSFAGEDKLEPKRLEGLSKINIFVGANNSGKSRLIRHLAKANEIVFEPRNEAFPWGEPVRNISSVSSRLRERINTPSVSGQLIADRWQLTNPFAEIAKQNLMGLTAIPFARKQNTRNTAGISVIREKLSDLIRSRLPDLLKHGFTHAARELEGLKESIDRATAYELAANGIERIYIPTLRTLRDLGNHALYRSRTVDDYKIAEETIFTGQSLYQDVESLLRGTLTDRETLRSFEQWLSESFFEGSPVALIPRSGQTTLTVKIGDEHEKPIHELGDGIQSLLILTFPLFRKSAQHLLVFMEEPELFLHPWLQRAFLEVLSTRFPKHQYFLTTHSNHFLDLTLDLPEVSVYTLEKHIDNSVSSRERSADFHVRQVSRDDRKPLELLGVRNSSVFLSNCTIWVEGVTDRRYIAHWLKLYQDREVEGSVKTRVFKEDLHYSFVEYGGGNITHFSFLDEDDEIDSAEKRILVDRLCAKLFLIIDKDGDKKSDRKALLERRLADRFYCLPGREIENLLKPEVIQRVLSAYGEEDAPLFKKSQILDKKLGESIDRTLGQHRNRRSAYADENGVLKGKVLFCERALSATQKWSDVSEEAAALTEKVYQFITDLNPK